MFNHKYFDWLSFKNCPVINLRSLKQDADKDQDFLSKESQYLQSIGSWRYRTDKLSKSKLCKESVYMISFFLNRINWHNRDIRWNSSKHENLFLRFITCEIWYNKAMTAYYIFIENDVSSFPLCKTQLSFNVILTASIFWSVSTQWNFKISFSRWSFFKIMWIATLHCSWYTLPALTICMSYNF